MSENMNHKLVVVGDIHLQSKSPKYDNAIDTLNFIFNDENLNNENNEILFLGDLCEINSPFSCFEKFVDYFVNRSRFNQIYLLTGNHDVANLDNVLALFRPLKNVKVITDWEIVKFYNCKILALPFYNHEGVADKQPMTEVYSNLYKNEELMKMEIDYCCGHLESDRCHFSKKYCDLSKLTNVKHFLHGHIHNCDIDKGYLGSACMNSVSESGIDKKIAIIDGETKACEFITLPKFLEYYEVEYPNKLPKIDTKYGLFLVRNSLDKKVTEEEYSKQAEQMGFKFYARKILSKKSKVLEVGEIEKTENFTFDDFADSVELDDSIRDICKEVIKLKGE